MSKFDVNVEFGKCPLLIDEDDEDISKEDDDEETSSDDIRTGSLYFDEHRNDSKHIPFLLTPYSIDMDKFFEKLFVDWGLPRPRIVLFSVAETEDSPSDEYRKISQKLVKGLVHALNTTEMWLCTDGLNSGFSRDIGRAFENEISRRKTLEKGIQKTHSVFPDTALIGICKRDILTFSSKFGASKTPENVEDETVRKHDINRRYEYFIIVDDTTETGNGVSKFMLSFAHHVTKHEQEKQIERMKQKEHKDVGFASDIESSETPVMALLLHGKITQLELILGHLKRGLPLVVFQGSGGLADLLAYGYSQANSRPEGTNFAEYTESVLKPQISDKLHALYPQLSDYIISSLSEKIFDCIRYSKQREQEYITVLNLNTVDYQPSKLPNFLLKALFKSQPSDKLKGVHQMKKDLFLAMDWNTAQVAMEEVFARDRSSRFQIDSETFFRALTKPQREDFVSLFLNQGFVIHTFLNSSILLSLFQNSLNREFFRSVVWESVLGYGSNVEISRSFLDSKLIILIEELTGIPSLVNSYELDWNCRAIYDDRTPQEAERKALAILVLWAILSYRVQLVKTIWRHSEQPVHLALACSIILRKLETFVADLSLKNEMEKHSKEFSVIAASVMTLCFDGVPCRAIDVLNEKNPVWSHRALMEMAAFAKNKMYLAHPSCQKYLDNIFMGKIKIRDLPYGDITMPVWLKIVFSTFFIFPMYLWIRFEPPPVTKPADDKNLDEKLSEQVLPTDSKEEKVAKSRSWKEKLKQPGFFYKIYYLWTAPISKFWVSQVFYTLFLCLFSLAVIWPACGNIYLDFATCIWIATIIMDSIYHTYILNTKYASMPLVYKCIEISLMIIFVFAYAMGRLIWRETFMTPYNAKVMICVALLYFYYRLIFVALPISSELGPMLYRVKRMTVVDFTSYIRVTILVIISNGIAIHATIYPDFPMSIELFRRAFYDAIISFFLTPSDHYGVPNPKCIRLKRFNNKLSFYGLPENECKVGRYLKSSCPNPGVWPYLFGLQYLIILRLILVVLLFALFSNTARKLEEQGKYIWKYQRYELVINFSNRLALPPPLCVITFIYMLCKFLYRKIQTNVKKYVFKAGVNAKTHAQDRLDETDFRYWKTLAIQQHNKTKQKKEEEMTIKKRMERVNGLADALNKQRRTLRDLEGNLNELQIEIKNAHQYLEGTGLQASVRERLQAKNVPQIFSRMSPYPNTMVQRFPVSDNHVPWSCNWTSYDPIAYTMPKEGFPQIIRPHVDVDIQRKREIEGESFRMPLFNWNAISESPGGVSTDRKSWINTDKPNRTFEYELDSEDLPRNPLGRTGLKGRGGLPRWGPNHYIYVVITRYHEKETFNNYLDVVLMNVPDGLALPGGYVHTENRYEIIHSLFQDEALWRESQDMKTFFESCKDSAAPKRSVIFKRLSTEKQKQMEDFTSERVKLGYMDEETNTDQAWCEAEVWHYHYNVVNQMEDKFKAQMEWRMLSEQILVDVPIGQAALMHSIAKDMKVVLEVM